MRTGGRIYLENLEFYAASVRQLQSCLAGAMEGLMPTEVTERVLGETWEAFVAILPEVPYIGGQHNPLTEDLLGAAYEMGFYSLMERQGWDLEKISGIDKAASREVVRRKIAGLGLETVRGFVLDGETLERGAEVFKKMGFPDNWAYEVVMPGVDERFDTGINYTQCPIVGLYRKFGKEKFLPFICSNDFPVFEEMGISLERSQTLAEGAPMCDFRFRRIG